MSRWIKKRMDRARYRLYIYACAQRRLREATTSGTPSPEAVQSVMRYLRAQYPLAVDEWALLVVALVEAAQQEAA